MIFPKYKPYEIYKEPKMICERRTRNLANAFRQKTKTIYFAFGPTFLLGLLDDTIRLPFWK